MGLRIAKVAGLAVVAMCWAWARNALWSDTLGMIVVWCAFLFTFPIAIAGRRALDVKPVVHRVELSPGWIFLVKRYEERELQIRFGADYEEYRARTPFLLVRRPRPARLAHEAASSCDPASEHTFVAAGENGGGHVRHHHP